MAKKETSSKIAKGNDAAVCSSCGAPEVYSKGLCKKCYKHQWYLEKRKGKPASERKPGHPTLTGEPKPEKCVICGNTPVYARGRCYKCYKRIYQRGTIKQEGNNTDYKTDYAYKRTINRETGEKELCSYCGIRPVYAHYFPAGTPLEVRKTTEGKAYCRNCYERANRNHGDPSYKGRSYERTLRSEKALLRKQAREKKSKEEDDG